MSRDNTHPEQFWAAMIVRPLIISACAWVSWRLGRSMARDIAYERHGLDAFQDRA